jgi:molecular chaperone DnaK (HSP70)
MHCDRQTLQVLGASHDLTVGGLFFDELIREHFHQHFLQQYKLDAQKNPRAWLRLLDESERLKKQMSANIGQIPLNIECFMDDKDVSGKVSRYD